MEDVKFVGFIRKLFMDVVSAEDYNKLLDKYKLDFDVLNTKYKNKDFEIKELNVALDVKTKELAEVKRTLEILKNENIRIIEENKKFNLKVNELDNSNAELLETNEELSLRVKARDGEISRLEKANTALDEKLLSIVKSKDAEIAKLIKISKEVKTSDNEVNGIKFVKHIDKTDLKKHVVPFMATLTDEETCDFIKDAENAYSTNTKISSTLKNHLKVARNDTRKYAVKVMFTILVRRKRDMSKWYNKLIDFSQSIN